MDGLVNEANFRISRRLYNETLALAGEIVPACAIALGYRWVGVIAPFLGNRMGDRGLALQTLS